MGFQRAGWHSGLTYQQTCTTCKTVLQYTDYSLDFRPWYADGYVDCPKCKTHLRHNENYALGNPAPQPQAVETPVQEQPAYTVSLEEQASVAPVQEAPAEQPAYAVDLAQQTGSAQALPVFCTGCGNKFGENDRFCAQCGSKRG